MSEEEVIVPQKQEDQVLDENLDRRTLFVRSIPFEATSSELEEFFSQFVPVKHAVIVNDENQKSRGFGFVSFTLDEDTLTALVESRKSKFKGRLLRVDIAKRRERKDRTSSSVTASKERTVAAPVEKRRARLIIRNLPWSCKKPDQLKKIFLSMVQCTMRTSQRRKVGRCGFAFVTMKKDSAAEKAVKDSVGLKIDDREVAVDLAIEKSKWEEIKEDEDEEEEEENEEEDEEEIDPSQEDEVEENDDEESDVAEDFDELNNPDSKVAEEDEEEKEEEEIPRKKNNKQEAFALFVRNIPYDATPESLEEHFEQFGPVKYALPVIDRESGLAKGSAFVAFKKKMLTLIV